MSKFFQGFMALAISAFLSGAAFAGPESGWAAADQMQARLLSASETIGPETGVFEAGLQIRIAPEWHSYWRSPGDSGLPPRFDWEESENVESVKISWPAPRRFEEMGLQTFGYQEDVLFPLAVTLEKPGAPTVLALKLEAMVCRDICIPQSLRMRMILPAGEGAASAHAPLVAHAKDRLPETGENAALQIQSVIVGPEALVVRAYDENRFKDADLFAEAGDTVLTAPPKILPDAADGRQAMLRIPAPEGVADLSAALTGKTLILTLVSGRKALEKTVGF